MSTSLYKLFETSKRISVSNFKKKLLEDINYIDEEGFNSLHYAVLFQHTEITKFLIDKKIDLNKISNSGSSALGLALVMILEMKQISFGLNSFALLEDSTKIFAILKANGAKLSQIEENRTDITRIDADLEKGVYLSKIRAKRLNDSITCRHVFKSELAKYEPVYEAYLNIKNFFYSKAYERVHFRILPKEVLIKILSYIAGTDLSGLCPKSDDLKNLISFCSSNIELDKLKTPIKADNCKYLKENSIDVIKMALVIKDDNYLSDIIKEKEERNSHSFLGNIKSRIKKSICIGA